jgi:transcription initiation factor TFIID subunit 2
MDLSTARAKLDAGMYSSRQDFVKDVELIVSNCLLFNMDGSDVHRAGQAFEAAFQKGKCQASARTSATELMTEWAKLESTLSRSKAGPTGAAVVVKSEASERPPPPGASQSVKLKVKPLKQANDGAPREIVPPMAPPPVPPSRKNSFVTSEPTKKRKPVTSELDDLLGAEVDAMAPGHAHSQGSFDALLEPKAKKQKLPRPEVQDRPVERSTPKSDRPTDKPKPMTISFTKPTPAPTFTKPTPAPTQKRSVEPEIRHKSPEKKRRMLSPKPRATPPPAPTFTASPAPAAAPAPASQPVYNEVPLVPYTLPVPPSDLPPTKSNSFPFKVKRARALVTTLQKDPSAGIVSRITFVEITADLLVPTTCQTYRGWLPDIPGGDQTPYGPRHDRQED